MQNLHESSRVNLALSLVTSCYGLRLYVWDRHAVGWGEGPWPMVTPEKASGLGVGGSKPRIK